MHRFAVIDVFTDQAFSGNPAAVVLVNDPLDEQAMQAIAAEFNLSATAFALGRADGTWGLRWFTRTAEVELCGHATVATARLVWDLMLAPADRDLAFETRSGTLVASRDDDRVVVDFPAAPAAEAEPPEGLEAVLGVAPVFVGRVDGDAETANLMAVLPSEADVVAMDPDPAAIAALPLGGLIVTAEAEGHAFDCVSRYFAPRYGIDEDPVTGSMHCTVGPYWAERLDRATLNARQASARGGTMHAWVDGDRVVLSGTAVTVMTGELLPD